MAQHIIFGETPSQGLSDSKWSGILGSFAALVGIDFHSQPGTIKVQQKLTKESETTVDALCRVRIALSEGTSLWFSYTTGKIWYRSSGGTWTLVYTTSPATGAAGCLGAEEFDGFVYWATQSRLHRIATTATLSTAAGWNAGVSINWATFTNTQASYHPMQKQNLQLFIGDKNYVAKVSGATGSHAFTANALDIRQPLIIKTMIDFDIDILIGTYVADTVNKTEVIRWDTEASSWDSSDPIEENGINAFLRDDNYVYAQCGKAGRFYLYNGEQLVPFKRIPGTWSPTQTAEVYPQAVGTLLTIPVFGLSNVAGNPTNQGVYSLGSYSKDYPKIMDLSYPISDGVLTTMEVGAILVMGADMLVSWKNGSSFGVDKLDYTAKYASAYIETKMLTPAGARGMLKSVSSVFINYITLPASTAISIKYKTKHDASFSAAMNQVDDTNLFQIRSDEVIPNIAALQLRFDFTVSSNNAPEVESIGYVDNQ